MPYPIPARSATACYTQVTDVQRLLQIFSESHTHALNSRNPDTANSRFGTCVEIYYQISALCPGTDLEEKITQATQALADCFPSVVCINESLGICDKANELKSIRKKLEYLRKAQAILERGLCLQDIGYASIKPIHEQVVGYVKQAEAIVQNQAKNPNQPNAPRADGPASPVSPSVSDFKFGCPNCDQHISVPLSLAGTTAVCPACAHELTIPQPT
jgi:hypothetical protein